ncbi:hypothetical protein [Alteribacillus sp. HJP-4]|uniref:hypothetical protein n=1 Tax=Alteribacillus sp. HJP-4 TaxID=2775394 RepID=UPI0035CCF041
MVAFVALAAIMLSTAAGTVSAAGPFKFTTGNDEWDAGSFTATNGADVTVFINNWGTSDTLKVRLSSFSACTNTKPVTYEKNYTTFTNLADGTYYGWVEKVSNPSRDVTGYITYRVE